MDGCAVIDNRSVFAITEWGMEGEELAVDLNCAISENALYLGLGLSHALFVVRGLWW